MREINERDLDRISAIHEKDIASLLRLIDSNKDDIKVLIKEVVEFRIKLEELKSQVESMGASVKEDGKDQLGLSTKIALLEQEILNLKPRIDETSLPKKEKATIYGSVISVFLYAIYNFLTQIGVL